MAAGSTYTPIATATGTGSSGTITFSSISGSYTDLILIISGTASGNSDLRLTFNGATTGFSDTNLYGTGTTAGSQRRSNNSRIQDILFYTTESNAIIQIMNYANTTTYKTVLSRSNVASADVSATVGLWQSTSAITSLTLVAGTSNFNTGSTFTLYGIAAA
jgi:hypothetical protein